MATDTEPDGALAADASLRWRRRKGRLFEAVLVGATLFGVLSLVALFLFISLDALGPLAVEPAWYLLYFGTLVTPISAYTLYTRHNPAVAAVSARAFAVAFGTFVLSLVVYAVTDALGPHDVAVYLVTITAFPTAVFGYIRRYGQNNLTGPAVPVSVLVGIAVGAVVHGPVIELIGIAADWILFLLIVTLPAAGIVGVAARRRFSRRAGLLAAVLVVAGALATVGVTLGVLGRDPSLWIVLVSGFVAPVGLFVADTLNRYPAGRIGLLGPAVIVGGIVAGAALEGMLGVAGLDAWLTPTLLLDSWSDFRAEQAGIYPQLVGSVIIVSLMAIMSFPVGVGAAIYLEEYAPATGWWGRLASALDVNISNLAGVPSVVYGLLGLALFRNALGLQPGLVIAAGATLGLLILPIVIVSAQEALRSVPDELRRGSYGLGASRWQTIRNVVLPEAVPGILTGTILALGRAIGETAPLVMIGVATTRFSPPEGIFSGATALPLQIFASAGNAKPEFRTGVVAAAALVLLVTMLLMNATAILIRNRYQNQ